MVNLGNKVYLYTSNFSYYWCISRDTIYMFGGGCDVLPTHRGRCRWRWRPSKEAADWSAVQPLPLTAWRETTSVVKAVKVQSVVECFTWQIHLPGEIDAVASGGKAVGCYCHILTVLRETLPFPRLLENGRRERAASRQLCFEQLVYI